MDLDLDVFCSLKTMYSEPTKKPKPDVFVQDSKFSSMDIDPECIRTEHEPSSLYGGPGRQWNGYNPDVDCKHRVVFDLKPTWNKKRGWHKFETQVALMSCHDIAAVLSNSIGKEQGPVEQGPVEHHCLECREERDRAKREGRLNSSWDGHVWDGHISEYVRVESLNKKRKKS